MVYLYVHVIWCVGRREALLTRQVRKVLFSQLQKEAGEKGIRIVAIGGVEDHVHCLLQLMPAQNRSKTLDSELQVFDKFQNRPEAGWTDSRQLA